MTIYVKVQKGFELVEKTLCAETLLTKVSLSLTEYHPALIALPLYYQKRQGRG